MATTAEVIARIHMKLALVHELQRALQLNIELLTQLFACTTWQLQQPPVRITVADGQVQVCG